MRSQNGIDGLLRDTYGASDVLKYAFSSASSRVAVRIPEKIRTKYRQQEVWSKAKEQPAEGMKAKLYMVNGVEHCFREDESHPITTLPKKMQLTIQVRRRLYLPHTVMIGAISARTSCRWVHKAD